MGTTSDEGFRKWGKDIAAALEAQGLKGGTVGVLYETVENASNLLMESYSIATAQGVELYRIGADGKVQSFNPLLRNLVAAIREEAAKLCDDQAAVYVQKRDAVRHGEEWERRESQRDTAEHLAGEIRALP